MKASKAFVLSACVLLVGASGCSWTQASGNDCNAKFNTLSTEDIHAGWIMLFDGETSFGWKTEVDSVAANGVLNAGGGEYRIAKTTTEFSFFNLAFEYRGNGVEVVLNGQPYSLNDSKGNGWMQAEFTVTPAEKGHKVAFAVV